MAFSFVVVVLSSSIAVAAAATLPKVYIGQPSHGLTMSRDGGKTWDNVLDTGSDTVTSVFAVDSSIYVGGGGLRMSRDDGKTWVATLPGITVNSLFVVRPKIYVATTVGLWMSGDDGKSWTIGLSNRDILEVAAAGPMVYAVSYGGTLWISEDDGETWNSAVGAPTVHSLFVQ